MAIGLVKTFFCLMASFSDEIFKLAFFPVPFFFHVSRLCMLVPSWLISHLWSRRGFSGFQDILLTEGLCWGGARTGSQPNRVLRMRRLCMSALDSFFQEAGSYRAAHIAVSCRLASPTEGALRTWQVWAFLRHRFLPSLSFRINQVHGRATAANPDSTWFAASNAWFLILPLR